MVVKPEELEERTKEDEQAVKRIEKKIDDDLRESDPKKSSYLIELAFWPTPRVMGIIEKMYKDAGWGNVKFISSQQDSKDYVKLSKK